MSKNYQNNEDDNNVDDGICDPLGVVPYVGSKIQVKLNAVLDLLAAKSPRPLALIRSGPPTNKFNDLLKF